VQSDTRRVSETANRPWEPSRCAAADAGRHSHSSGAQLHEDGGRPTRPISRATAFTSDGSSWPISLPVMEPQHDCARYWVRIARGLLAGRQNWEVARTTWVEGFMAGRHLTGGKGLYFGDRLRRARRLGPPGGPSSR